MKNIVLIVLLLFGSWATAQNIAGIEYFIDGPDPGVGNGTALSVTSNSGALTQPFSIPTTGLSDGFHSIYVRSQTSEGNWSHYHRTVFYIVSMSETTQELAAAEYFFDNDPGVGNGSALALATDSGFLVQSFSIPTAGLTEGFHSLYIRSQNSEGNWSLYDRKIVYINNSFDEDEPLVAAEYFFDEDPGIGNGIPLALDENTGQLTQSFGLVTTGLTEGTHMVYIRVQAENGSWSLYDNASFIVNTLSIDNTVSVSENTLVANFDNASATYQWLDCDNANAVIDGATEQSYTATETGNYAVQITYNGETVVSECVSIEVTVQLDSDNDGIADEFDLCPNTPSNTLVDFNGCSVFTLSATNFTLKTTGESCIDNNDGAIELSAVEDLNYTAHLTATGGMELAQEFTSDVAFEGLPSGTYDLCITVDGEAEYEQCFQVIITQPESLTAGSKVNVADKSVTFDLNGSTRYYININGKIYDTQKEQITLPLNKIENSISIYGEKGCQGVYEKMIVLTNQIMAYPNPIVVEQLSVYMGSPTEFKKVRASVFNLSGSKLLDGEFEVVNGYLQIDFGRLSQGTYILSVHNKTQLFNHKIIKQ